jgi:hypothetical protein
VTLGNLEENHRSNILVFFDTGYYSGPIDGKCSRTYNRCLSGVFSDTADDNI